MDDEVLVDDGGLAPELSTRQLVISIAAGLAFAGLCIYVIEKQRAKPCNCHDVDDEPAAELEPDGTWADLGPSLEIVPDATAVPVVAAVDGAELEVG